MLYELLIDALIILAALPLVFFVGVFIGQIALWCACIPLMAGLSALAEAVGIENDFGSKRHLLIWWISYSLFASWFIYMFFSTTNSSKFGILRNPVVQVTLKVFYAAGVILPPNYFFWSLWALAAKAAAQAEQVGGGKNA